MRECSVMWENKGLLALFVQVAFEAQLKSEQSHTDVAKEILSITGMLGTIPFPRLNIVHVKHLIYGLLFCIEGTVLKCLYTRSFRGE